MPAVAVGFVCGDEVNGYKIEPATNPANAKLSKARFEQLDSLYLWASGTVRTADCLDGLRQTGVFADLQVQALSAGAT